LNFIISKDEIIEGSWQHGRLIEEKKQQPTTEAINNNGPKE
jgi:hypothetical protein